MTNKKTEFRVIVIDPETKRVSVQMISAENTLKEWYATIGNGCTLVTTALNSYDQKNAVDNTLLMDDEILLRFDDIKGAYRFGENGPVYFNAGIISGCDEFGETCDCSVSADNLFQQIIWLNKEEALKAAEQVMLEPIKIITY